MIIWWSARSLWKAVFFCSESQGFKGVIFTHVSLIHITMMISSNITLWRTEDLAANISKSGFKGEILPSGKRLQKTMDRSTMLLMGKLTISMAIFNSYVKLPEGIMLYPLYHMFFFSYMIMYL